MFDFQAFLQNLLEMLPRLLGAIVLFFIGWLVAAIVKSIATKVAKRLNADRSIDVLKEAGEKTPQDPKARPSNIVGIVAFWVVMLFVIIGVLNILQLGAVAQPFQQMLGKLSEGLPNLLAAVGLLLVGFFLGKWLKGLAISGLQKFKLEDKLAERDLLAEDAARRNSVSKAVGIGVYVLVLFVFIQLAAETIGLTLAVSSLQRITNSLADAIPAILAAALIVGIAWLIATIVRPIIDGLLSSFGINKWGEHVGLATDAPAPDVDDIDGQESAAADRPLTLSAVIANVAYWIIILLAVPSALDRLGLEPIVTPLRNAWNVVFEGLPNFVVALFIGVVTYFLAKLVGPLVQRLLQGIGFDSILDKIGLVKLSKQAEGNEKARPSYIAAAIVVALIVLLLAQEALKALGMTYLAAMIAEILAFTPNILVAIAIIGFALFFGNWLKGVVESAASRMDQGSARIMGMVAYIAVVFFGGAMALTQLNIAPDIIQTAVTVLLGAVGVAVALAFGLGGQGVAKQWLEKKSGELEAAEADARAALQKASEETGADGSDSGPATPRTYGRGPDDLGSEGA